MSTLKYILTVSVLAGCLQQNYAQTLNYNSLQKAKHVISIGAGWDYGLSYNAGYAYKVNTKKPLVLNTNLSLPFGEKLLDDFKTKLGGQVVVFDNQNLKGGFALNGIFRRYQNPLVGISNLGAELKGIFGYYKLNWFLAGEIGLDRAMITHFKHTDKFKTTIYPEIEDGWSKKATGTNFQLGLQTGYSFKQCDLVFTIGNVRSRSKTSPLIPYYLNLGFNYRLL
ncbi:MAG: hypothetical protein KF763_09985 [Cyclobacteriaceae bacterium]|nr:hypothetical protein [Cyclobacteriaceae bacterium]